MNTTFFTSRIARFLASVLIAASTFAGTTAIASTASAAEVVVAGPRRVIVERPVGFAPYRGFRRHYGWDRFGFRGAGYGFRGGFHPGFRGGFHGGRR
jgi:hypothetical protein